MLTAALREFQRLLDCLEALGPLPYSEIGLGKKVQEHGHTEYGTCFEIGSDAALEVPDPFVSSALLRETGAAQCSHYQAHDGESLLVAHCQVCFDLTVVSLGSAKPR